MHIRRYIIYPTGLYVTDYALKVEAQIQGVLKSFNGSDDQLPKLKRGEADGIIVFVYGISQWSTLQVIPRNREEARESVCFLHSLL